MAHRGSIPASVQDWFFSAVSLGHDQAIRLVLEMDGRVDHPRLVRALGLLFEVEPIARSRLVEGFFRAVWEPREDLEPSAACLLASSSDPVRDVHDCMVAPIDPRREPVVQVRVFRSTRDTVCVKVCHVAMDGGGLKQFVQKLTTLYRGIGTDGVQPALLPVVVERRQSVALRSFSAWQRLRAFLTQPFHEKRWRFPFLAGTPSEITFSERTSLITVPQLREAARARGVTITDALFTAFVRAIFGETETPAHVPLPFTVAMDLRRFVSDPGILSMCNLSSLSWIELVHEPSASIETTLAAVHEKLGAALADAPGIGLAMVMEIVSPLGYRLFVAGNRLRIRMAQREGREFPSLSNIGPIDNRLFDFGNTRITRARFYGPVIYPPTFYIVSGSFENSLYYTMSYPRNLVPGNLAEAILDRTVAELDSLRLEPRP
ncbi:MAG: hypothetical protein A2177_11775 [Spirochaetes bacterium RBG_13_68_11]|nr:MAG: hypothetical protein A2177_11775 [Spirochaetes bacterium RBG_13_68_11]